MTGLSDLSRALGRESFRETRPASSGMATSRTRKAVKASPRSFTVVEAGCVDVWNFANRISPTTSSPPVTARELRTPTATRHRCRLLHTSGGQVPREVGEAPVRLHRPIDQGLGRVSIVGQHEGL